MARDTWAQGIEHGWVARPVKTDGSDAVPSLRRRFVLSDWLPAAVAARGKRVSRETDRAFADLRAARDAHTTDR